MRRGFRFFIAAMVLPFAAVVCSLENLQSLRRSLEFD